MLPVFIVSSFMQPISFMLHVVFMFSSICSAVDCLAVQMLFLALMRRYSRGDVSMLMAQSLMRPYFR
jgi:hypothetical protein